MVPHRRRVPVDDDGWYYFVDRLRDTIRRRGENISSFEVETFVTEHDDVLECAAIGVPATHGEDDVMVAVIVRDPATFDPAALVEFLEPRMPRFMLPRYVEVVDDLPARDVDARAQARDPRPRRHRRHLRPGEAVGLPVGSSELLAQSPDADWMPKEAIGDARVGYERRMNQARVRITRGMSCSVRSW